jgi:hypothetical protein
VPLLQPLLLLLGGSFARLLLLCFWCCIWTTNARTFWSAAASLSSLVLSS